MAMKIGEMGRKRIARKTAAMSAPVDIDAGELVTIGKGNRQRNLWVDNGAADALADWLEENDVHAWSDMPVWSPLEGPEAGHPFIDVSRALATGLLFGLGLSISKKIVELHGGNLMVESPPEGGTTFMVELPLGFVEQPDEEPLFIGLDEQ